MKKHILISVKNGCLFWFILGMCSCAPSYVPNVINTPMFKQAGELQGAAHTGISGFDPQVSYAITENIGLMVNGSFANQTSDTTDNYHKHSFIEAGVGFYKNYRSIGVFEVYGGYGMGTLNAFYENDLWSDQENVKTNRLFLQPAVGINTGYFIGSLSPRLVYVNLLQEPESLDGIFIEPVLTGKLGLPYVKMTLQVGFS
ncbi:MAG: hypothetical protein ACOC10_08515, partial [Bacteroidota bacterium]